MNEFFEQNIWASGLFLFILFLMLIYSYYQKVKENKHLLSNIFGEKWAVLVPMIAIIALPFFTYFVLVPMFAVDTSAIETVEQAKEYSANNTNFLTPIYEGWNNLWGYIFNKAQQNPKIAGTIISANGLLILIASILNHNWILKDNTNTPRWTIADIVQIFGRKIGRIIMGFFGITLIFYGLLIFFT